VDRHRFDADPDSNVHVDTDPDPDPDSDWQQNIASPHADPTPSFTHLRKPEYFFSFIHSIAKLQWFVFLISVKCAIILSIFLTQY
jgi:hypothetical protein